MKKQRKQLIILVIVLLLLVAGYFGLQKYNEAQNSQVEEESAEMVLDLEKEDVTEISYTYEGEELSFIKEGDTWKYREDTGLTITQNPVNSMVSLVTRLESKGRMENVTDMSEYGLDKPERVITFVIGDTAYEIAVGDYNDVSSVYYVCVDNSTTVYAVSGVINTYFDYALEDLVEVEETEESAEEVTAE